MPGLFGASAAVMRVCRLPDPTPPARLRADARGRDGGVRAARLTELGTLVHTGSPADFRKFIAAETEKWAKVIRAANIKPM
jgi:hypothetical protein